MAKDISGKLKMNKNKTIKREFYYLILKIFIYTAISTLVTYILFFSYVNFGNVKSQDYYLKYIKKISDEIKDNGNAILQGHLIDLNKYDDELQGEVIDLQGNHLYGEKGIQNEKFDLLSCINQELYDNHYIYKYVAIIDDNSIKAIYVLKAPFDFIINNSKDNKLIAYGYVIVMFSPLIYLIIYIFIFISKLYKKLNKDIGILLEGVENVANGDLNFNITGTERKEFKIIEEAFNNMMKAIKENVEALSKLDEERKMMVSSIAHDIRTPITIIKGQLEILDDIEKIPYANMKIINRNCDKMTTLTENLSLLYKVEGAGFLVRKEEVDLVNLLNDKKAELESIVEKDLDINFEVSLTKDIYILDSTMILRVLDNILYNSIRFTKEGEIGLKVYDVEDKIYFKCCDTGTGFKDGDLTHIFEAFYQDKSYKDHFGLGLYISKKIVENFNGAIKAYNNEVTGATIEFYIKELN